MTYGMREHRFLLEDSLKTSKRISKDKFKELLPKYNYYGYDYRIKQIVYIAKDIINEKYTWLYIKLNYNDFEIIDDKKVKFKTKVFKKIYEDNL